MSSQPGLGVSQPAGLPERVGISRVLVITGMYPSGAAPAFGKFVQLQVEALRQLGCEQEVMIIKGRNRFLKYVLGFLEMRKRLRTTMYSNLHAYYGLCGFIASLQARVP